MTSTDRPNLTEAERGLTLLLGGTLVLRALGRGGRWSLPLAAAGGALLYRALTGYCPLYRALGVRSSTEAGEAGGRVTPAAALLVDRSVTIQRPPAEVYRFWRALENLPRCLSHVEEVRVEVDGTSHWTVRGPAGPTAQWNAELTADVPDELIAWATREGSDVWHDGAVRFTAAPGQRGTEVRVRLRYEPVAGKLGALVARLFGEDPAQQIGRDLRRLKQVLEAGEVATGARRRS